MLFLEYPKCSTCKKAKKWLDEQGISYEDRHVIEDNPTVWCGIKKVDILFSRIS